MQGRLFTPGEALEIGLVDELAADKNEAIQKAIGALTRLDDAVHQARHRTKLQFRQEILERFEENREKDVEESVKLVTQPSIQRALEVYLASLGRKKKK